MRWRRIRRSLSGCTTTAFATAGAHFFSSRRTVDFETRRDDLHAMARLFVEFRLPKCLECLVELVRDCHP